MKNDPKYPIAVAYGDGIGPEIMQSALRILEEAGSRIEAHSVSIGEKVYMDGNPKGISEEAWDILLNKTSVFLKAPITTPSGKGYKSLNVATRKRLGLFANIRPCISYAPIIENKHPEMDLVIIRENEEDLYAGIEYQQSMQVRTCLKITSRPACERIIRYAFEYACAHKRKKVTCFTKDNIMKLTDGLFHLVFNQVAAEYPSIQSDHYIVDIGAARVSTKPEDFDVIVMPNLYGDIISDITAELTGSVGLVGTANIGQKYAMFEAIHGSAPAMAGKDIANPSALILASVQMLVHIGQTQEAERIHNAWLYTLEQGIHTPDIFSKHKSKSVETSVFTKALIKNLGNKPVTLAPISYEKAPLIQVKTGIVLGYNKEWVGVDVFIEWQNDTASLTDKVMAIHTEFKLESITNRGVEIWPNFLGDIMCVDQYRLRFMLSNMSVGKLIELLSKITTIDLSFIRVENLYKINGEDAFSKDE